MECIVQQKLKQETRCDLRRPAAHMYTTWWPSRVSLGSYAAHPNARLLNSGGRQVIALAKRAVEGLRHDVTGDTMARSDTMARARALRRAARAHITHSTLATGASSTPRAPSHCIRHCIRHCIPLHPIAQRHTLAHHPIAPNGRNDAHCAAECDEWLRRFRLGFRDRPVTLGRLH